MFTTLFYLCAVCVVFYTRFNKTLKFTVDYLVSFYVHGSATIFLCLSIVVSFKFVNVLSLRFRDMISLLHLLLYAH